MEANPPPQGSVLPRARAPEPIDPGDVLFLSAGGYHHHLGFNTWKSRWPRDSDGHLRGDFGHEVDLGAVLAELG
jgi:hypothetical protein